MGGAACLYAYVAAQNLGSICVREKCGFYRVGDCRATGPRAWRKTCSGSTALRMPGLLTELLNELSSAWLAIITGLGSNSGQIPFQGGSMRCANEMSFARADFGMVLAVWP